jgi:hypothetical protein
MNLNEIIEKHPASAGPLSAVASDDKCVAIHANGAVTFSTSLSAALEHGREHGDTHVAIYSRRGEDWTEVRELRLTTK